MDDKNKDDPSIQPDSTQLSGGVQTDNVVYQIPAPNELPQDNNQDVAPASPQFDTQQSGPEQVSKQGENKNLGETENQAKNMPSNEFITPASGILIDL